MKRQDDSNILLDELMAEIEAAERSGVFSKFGRGLLAERTSDRIAALIGEALERPRNAADRNRKIHTRFRELRHSGSAVEVAREQLYADGFDRDAVDRVIEKGPA